MTESKIPELLAKLEKLDIETWLILREDMGRVDAIMGETWDSPGNPDYHQMRCEKLREYTIRGVIQDAIAKNPDIEYYKVDFSHTSQDYHLSIWRSGGFVEGDFAKSFAEAILSAYVAALEAQG